MLKSKDSTGKENVYVFVQSNSPSSTPFLSYLGSNLKSYNLIDVTGLGEGEDASKIPDNSKVIYAFFCSTRWDVYFDEKIFNMVENKTKNIVVFAGQFGQADPLEIPSEYSNNTSRIWINMENDKYIGVKGKNDFGTLENFLQKNFKK